MEVDWHDWKRWIDLQMSLAEIEAEISDIPDDYPAYLPWVMQWANVGLGERSVMHNLNRMSDRLRALSRRWP
jgi:hypothetical protein